MHDKEHLSNKLTAYLIELVQSLEQDGVGALESRKRVCNALDTVARRLDQEIDIMERHAKYRTNQGGSCDAFQTR